MERDILRIKTLTDGSRIGVSISSEYEKSKPKENNFQQSHTDELIEQLSRCEYELDNVESLEDGDYSINNFRPVYPAAHIVPEGEPTPISTAKHMLRYAGE